MKPNSKPLKLSVTTIRPLGDSELRRAAGGLRPSDGCPSDSSCTYGLTDCWKCPTSSVKCYPTAPTYCITYCS